MKKGDDGAADRARYVDEALEQCRRACRRNATVPVAMVTIRPLKTNDRASGWRLHILSLEGGLVDPTQLFRGLRDELDGLLAELEGAPPHESN